MREGQQWLHRRMSPYVTSRSASVLRAREIHLDRLPSHKNPQRLNRLRRSSNEWGVMRNVRERMQPLREILRPDTLRQIGRVQHFDGVLMIRRLYGSAQRP